MAFQKRYISFPIVKVILTVNNAIFRPTKVQEREDREIRTKEIEKKRRRRRKKENKGESKAAANKAYAKRPLLTFLVLLFFSIRQNARAFLVNIGR